MLSLQVKLEQQGVQAALDKLKANLQERENLNEALGSAAAENVRRHIAKTKKSPHTNWWARAAQSVKHDFDGDQATVYATQRGVRLRLEGGTVKQRPGGPLLAIPTDQVPITANTRKAPRELDLEFARSATGGKDGHTKGYLFTKSKDSQDSDGNPRGRLMYILRTQTTHQPDPSVLPEENALQTTLARAASDYILALSL